MAVRCVRRYRWEYLPKCVEVYVWRDKFLLRWVSRGGHCYSQDHVSFLPGGGESQRTQIMSRIWEGPVKRKDVKKIVSAKSHADPVDLRKSYSNLADFMTAAVYEGSSDLRESPTVTFWCSGGEWRCSVKDRAEKLVMWLSDTSLLALVRLLEDFCLNVEGPWRHEDPAHARDGKRVRK